MRVRIAASDAPMAIDGNTRYGHSMEPVPEELAPETGSQPSSVEKTRIRIGPRARPGIESPKRLTTESV